MTFFVNMIDNIIKTNKEMEDKAKNINMRQRTNYRKQFRGNRRNYRRY